MAVTENQGKWVMYDTYFGFRQRPFASVPQVDHYYAATAIEAARSNLARCLERGEGAGMVIGPSGTGKTLLCHLLAEQFRTKYQVATLASGRLSTRRSLLQAVLYGLGQAYRGMDEGEARLALVDYLTAGDDCPRGMVLLVDEAHTLPLRLLDEIRMLTNVTRAGQPRVRLVLAGGCALEERFASPKLDSFSQRVVARCYLEAFNRTETQEYIHTRIAAVGGNGETLFPEGTCQAVHRASDGVPRLVNQVCDHALLLAFAAGRRQIDPSQVEEAWGDLQQLPTPWNGECEKPASSASVVEFGGLDDLPAEPLGATGVSVEPLGATGVSPVWSEATEGNADAVDDLEEAEAASSALSISAETAGDDEPVEQLARIEKMLATVDDDFQPAGSIGPEVELIFDEPQHPFQEEFEEEEVICDRYARLHAARAQRPHTVSLHRVHAHGLRDAEDADMIIVEDDYDDSPAPVTCSIVAVRRQEYGQLFAKLRHG